MAATVHQLPTRPAPSLEPMMQLVAGDLNHVNSVILERMQSEVVLIPELAGHLIAGGGKRMRPMLTLACARCSIIPALGTTSSPPRSSSSTPPPSSTTTSWTARALGAASAPPTSSGAIRRAFWSAISSFRAPSS
jgi:hypothetical protein